MTEEAIRFYAAKFFAHLLPPYGRLAVIEVLKRHDFSKPRAIDPTLSGCNAFNLKFY